MSKEVKSQILSKVATLLDKFSDRLVRIANQTRQNTDAVAVLRDEIRLKAGRAEGIAVEANGKAERAHLALIHHGELIDSVKKENDVREDKQTLRDQNNVQSLVNLRESVQKGFDQVRADVDQLLRLSQRLNERVGQAESKIENTMMHVTAYKVEFEGVPLDTLKKFDGVYNVTEDLDNRIQKLEAGPCAAFHHMVGIEKRVTELEAEIELVTALRLAQAAFVAGPRKTPTAMFEKEIERN